MQASMMVLENICIKIGPIMLLKSDSDSDWLMKKALKEAVTSYTCTTVCDICKI